MYALSKWKVRTYFQEMSQLILGDFFQQGLKVALPLLNPGETGLRVGFFQLLNRIVQGLEHPDDLMIRSVNKGIFSCRFFLNSIMGYLHLQCHPEAPRRGHPLG
jgi:hypothetical protein